MGGVVAVAGVLRSSLWSALRGRVVLVPLVAMVAAQAVMVSVMTMTPVQMRHLGSGLDVVGWVISAHMAGMYALAPVSGRIADPWGGRPGAPAAPPRSGPPRAATPRSPPRSRRRAAPTPRPARTGRATARPWRPRRPGR
ncbi:hypothetical protein [Nocardia terpenica]|uniref:hypothetical protein n=1 Tax=Nocardia terpenica TaxID=455432 RepID=UPI000A754C0B|nr:hypothetical protein [Nocardia terpenica]